MAYNGSHFAPKPHNDGASEPVRAPRPVATHRNRASGSATAAGTRFKRTSAGSQSSGSTGNGFSSRLRNGGRRMRANGPWNRLPKRNIVVTVLAVVLGLSVVGGAIAWLVQSDFKVNAFDIGKVEIEINEDFNDEHTVKQNVTVTNEGSVPAYVRAQVNIYWVDANGNQLWETPSPATDSDTGDYTIEGNLPADTGWDQGTDGLYYWTTPLEPKEKTEMLINKIEQTDEQLAKYNDGRKLVVDIAVQSIQYEPADAVNEAWGVTVETDADGNASLKVENKQVVVDRTVSTGGSIETATEGEE